MRQAMLPAGKHEGVVNIRIQPFEVKADTLPSFAVLRCR